MPNEESIDELVDRLLNKTSPDDEDIKERKPKPFRYLTEEEADKELFELTPKSVMKSPDQPKILSDEIFITSMGDEATIENIIKKHQVSKKFKDNK